MMSRETNGRFAKISLEERFWAKVEKTDGCWLWRGFCNPQTRYGTIAVDGKSLLAHRVVYELTKGFIPKGLTIDHLCRKRACVNPDHLEIVSMKTNVLRGIGLTALHARATHCLQGHPYDLFNTYYTPVGDRDCRICRREAGNRRRVKQRLNIGG